ncbi:hypothetical protein R3D73_005445 [Serratia marcescens]|nr:hypothetical protein [Serratia marcescens]ELQ9442518.1 hypothetical protein [Serratia marcescens]ELT5563279.1 hypothetical protein [Serratia marcescens]
MTTIKRFTPDYKMHAVRFEAFAREAEHGELVRFDAHQQVVSTLEAERDAQQKRADALAVENASMREALDSIRIYSSDTLSGPSDSVPDMAAWLREGVEHLHQVSIIETPATSAALAAFEVRGVEKAAAALDALSAQSASATTQANFRAAAVYLRAEVLPAIWEAK